jgi:hypothetical protein
MKRLSVANVKAISGRVQIIRYISALIAEP